MDLLALALADGWVTASYDAASVFLHAHTGLLEMGKEAEADQIQVLGLFRARDVGGSRSNQLSVSILFFKRGRPSCENEVTDRQWFLLPGEMRWNGVNATLASDMKLRDRRMVLMNERERGR